MTALAPPAVALAACGGGAADEPETARYRLMLRSHWTAAAFPTQFPGNAHLTGIVGATHSAGFAFWTLGSAASLGIQNVAELGSKTALLGEVADAIAAGQAEFALSGGAATLSEPAVMLEFDASQRFPAVTLVSMLGPSPDWFTGIRGLLLRRDGHWLDGIDLDLLAYDAGTDNGATFTSGNAVNHPRGTVQTLNTAAADSDFLNGVHRASGQAVASLSMHRLS